MGIPGFKSLLRQLAELWRTRRAEVEKQANEFAEAMRRACPPPARAREDVAAADLVKAALDELDAVRSTSGSAVSAARRSSRRTPRSR